MVKCCEMAYLNYWWGVLLMFLRFSVHLVKLSEPVLFPYLQLVFMTKFAGTQYVRFCLLFTSVQFMPKPHFAFQQSHSPSPEFLTWKETADEWWESWWALSGKAHKRDLSVESPKSTQEMGPSPEPLVFVPVTVNSSFSSQPLWGFSWGLFGNPVCTPWRTGDLSTGAPLHPLLSSHRKLLSCSAPRRDETLGFMSDWRAALPCLWDAAWIRKGWNSCIQVSGRDWPLLSSVVSDLTRAAGITQEWAEVCPCPSRH